MSTPTSPQMGLPIPVPGVTPAPEWAQLIYACFNIVDGHDHTTGSGAPIPPGGLNINSDLTFGSNNATDLRTTRFTAQVSAIPASGSDLQELYVAGVDLYFNDGSGNQIRITQSGSVSGASGTITGLPSGTASASYSAGAGKFVFQSATNTSADLDFGAAIMRNTSASSFALTLQPPTLGANYSVTLPALPASQKFMTLDASGIMSAPWAVDGSTLEISSSTLQVKALGIGTAQLAAGSVTNPKLSTQVIATSSSSGTAYSNSTASYTDVTNMSVSPTASGDRPIQILVIPDGSGTFFSGIYDAATASGQIRAKLLKDGSVIAWQILGASTSGGEPVPYIQSLTFFDPSPTAGAHTYKLQLAATNSNNVHCDYMKMTAFEVR